jgi:hypothetical protein
VRRDLKVSFYLRLVYSITKTYFPNRREYWIDGGVSFKYPAREKAILLV